jgi:ketosteroid isomerase-like protein
VASQEKAETVRRGYEAFNRSDFDAIQAIAHPDLEFSLRSDQPSLRGIENFRAWMEPDAFEKQAAELVELTVAGNKVLVELEGMARGAGSGIEMELHLWSVWTFGDDGRVTRIQGFLEHEEAEAREAAGLQ